MDVRFSRHAIQRLKKRFAGAMSSVIRIIELGIDEQYAAISPTSSRAIEGIVHGRPVRVVVAGEPPGVVTIVTAMWL